MQTFTLKQICRILVENLCAYDIAERIKQNTVNKMMSQMAESEILSDAKKANYQFIKTGIDQYIMDEPYMSYNKAKQRMFKGYLHYHD